MSHEHVILQVINKIFNLLNHEKEFINHASVSSSTSEHVSRVYYIKRRYSNEDYTVAWHHRSASGNVEITSTHTVS